MCRLTVYPLIRIYILKNSHTHTHAHAHTRTHTHTHTHTDTHTNRHTHTHTHTHARARAHARTHAHTNTHTHKHTHTHSTSEYIFCFGGRKGGRKRRESLIPCSTLLPTRQQLVLGRMFYVRVSFYSLLSQTRMVTCGHRLEAHYPPNEFPSARD